MIDGVTNADAIPALERLMQFAEARHRLIANNVANFSTPGYRPSDVSVKDFQEHLGQAIDARRASHPGGGDLAVEDSSEVEFARDGLTLHAQPACDNLMFHDGNDRNVERTMQGLVENTFAFRTAAQLLKNRFELLTAAIRERL